MCAFAVAPSSEAPSEGVGGGRTGAETDGEARGVMGGDGTGEGPAAEAEAEVAPVTSREMMGSEQMPPPPPRLSNAITPPPLTPASNEAIRAQSVAARSRPATPEGPLLPASSSRSSRSWHPQPRRLVGHSPVPCGAASWPRGGTCGGCGEHTWPGYPRARPRGHVLDVPLARAGWAE